jgi:predicted metal-dependent enzyme (double-stranded beta helix superfamily)
MPGKCVNFKLAEFLHVHAVANTRLTGAIHVYGGDFFGVTRSEWDPETLLECPYDVEKAMRLFEQSNTRYAAT